LPGRIVSRPEDTLILLDDSLSPFIADALSLVGYNATSTRNVFDNRQGVTDREIIEWAGASNAVWVYFDDKPKRESAKTVLSEGVRTLWVHRPRGSISAREQLAIVSYLLPDLLNRLSKPFSDTHYRMDALGGFPRPRYSLRGYELE
jgi:predicted nuclease of predicted toxin-antitoxin system